MIRAASLICALVACSSEPPRERADRESGPHPAINDTDSGVGNAELDALLAEDDKEQERLRTDPAYAERLLGKGRATARRVVSQANGILNRWATRPPPESTCIKTAKTDYATLDSLLKSFDDREHEHEDPLAYESSVRWGIIHLQTCVMSCSTSRPPQCQKAHDELGGAATKLKPVSSKTR